MTTPNISLQELRDYLNVLPSGNIENTDKLEALMISCWNRLEGNDDGAMRRHKISGRLESVSWRSPVLSFAIERHGLVMMGSSKATVQHWEVNVLKGTAKCVQEKNRQLYPRAKPVYVKPIAEEISRKIFVAEEDPRFCWLADGQQVRVNLSAAIPGNALDYKQTMMGRRRRLRDCLLQIMSQAGWARVGTRGAVFQRPHN